MSITAEDVKVLRERTGAGVMESKRALEETEGNIDKAAELLRERGIAKAEKKVGRTANQGLIEAYVHAGGRIGVLVEVNCETDFVARTPEFKTLAHDIALQVAASRPVYVSRTDVPAEEVESQSAIYRSQAEDKPPAVIGRIVEGKLEKFYQEVVLLEQPFIRDPNLSVRQLITEHIAKLGENIAVRRFVRYELGGA